MPNRSARRLRFSSSGSPVEVTVSFVVVATGTAFTGGLVEGGTGTGAGGGSATPSGCSALQSTLNKESDNEIETMRLDYSSGGARRSSGGYKTA